MPPAAPPPSSRTARPATLAPVLALALLLPGCVLGGAPDDLFPVCEDRRASGPSPTYDVDRLAALTEVRGGTLSPEEERELLSAVRTRVLTLQGASYRSFHANLTPVEGEPHAWWFEARGTGGPSEDWDDDYRLTLLPRGDGTFEAIDTRATTHALAAPPTLEGMALRAYERAGGLDAIRNRTPAHAGSGIDPDLPACVLLTFDGAGGERTEVAVNVVKAQVVHVMRVGW